jgi:uncharacterized membrane protein
MRAVSGWLMFRPSRAYPAGDQQLGILCDQTQGWNRRTFWVSIAIWCVSFFTAYLALPLRLWLTFNYQRPELQLGGTDGKDN